MKRFRFFFSAAAACLGCCLIAAAAATDGHAVIVQDLGPALDADDPTNGGFWSIDWTDDAGVRHTHAGVAVSRAASAASAPLKASDLVVSVVSAPGSLKTGAPGLQLIFR